MITGDHLDTAVAIGKQLGIVSSEDQAVTGAVLDDLSDEELVRDIERYSVFARVQPRTSGLTGSIIPASPIKQRFCSRLSGEKEDGTLSYSQ